MSRHAGLARRHWSVACRGFGLFEAIVALALLAGTGLALFGWINQNLQAASRLRQHEQQAQLLLSAQTLIETVNPMSSPKGRLEVSGLAVDWDSEAVEPARANAMFDPEAPAVWQVGLFRLQVHAQDAVQGIELRFEQWRVGTQRLRPLSEVPP